mgnify:CR=1 FL=1
MLAAVWPVGRKLGLAYAVLILVFILPPLAAGGLISAGRFSSGAVSGVHLAGRSRCRPDIARRGSRSFAAFQALNAAMFYTWRPLY